MAPKVCFLGAVRRRTMICCRNVKISASSAARDRNRSTTAQTMSLKRYLITDQHRPILGQPPVNRFATGTGRQAGNIALLAAKIEALKAEIARLEARAADQRADFERERERADRLTVELMQ